MTSREINGIPVVESSVRSEHAERAQPFAHDRVVDQFAQNGERARGGQTLRLRDRVAHAETHPEMFCE